MLTEIPALPFDLHEIAGGTPPDLVALYRPSGLDGTAVEQELLRQRGLAGIGVADDGEGAPVFNFVLEGHGYPSVKDAMVGTGKGPQK